MKVGGGVGTRLILEGDIVGGSVTRSAPPVKKKHPYSEPIVEVHSASLPVGQGLGHASEACIQSRPQ